MFYLYCLCQITICKQCHFFIDNALICYDIIHTSVADITYQTLMAEQINIRFHQALNDFLPVDWQFTEFTHELKKTRSVKDLIESIGVPHTEVDLIIVNDESVDFNHLIQDHDRIEVLPKLKSSELTELHISPLRHCLLNPSEPYRFLLDVHLGKLAAYLRMLGFDSAYRNDYDDPALAKISAEDNRILLTCDRRLLMRKQVIYGYFVRTRQPRQQLLEVLSRFELYDQIRPFDRCMHCNGRIQAVDKKEIEAQLLAKTKKYHDEFYRCDSCHKIYWEGSHFQNMQTMIEAIRNQAELSTY